MKQRARRLPSPARFAAAAWISLLLAVAPPARGVEPTAPVEPSLDRLRQIADDPAPRVPTLQVADWYTINFRELKNVDANTVVVRPLIPFATGSIQHLFRATVPFITDNPVLSPGLGDTTLFDLIIFRGQGGRWGIGPAVLLPTGGRHRGAEKWAVGPALGYASRQGRFQWAILNQNLFTVAGNSSRRNVNVTALQPILSYGLGGGWSIGSSEMNFVYNWQAQRWTNLPVGPRLGKVFLFGRLPVQFNIAYEHDFANRRRDPENIVRFTTRFLFPKG
jgi:hypothetical protein